MKTLTPNAQKLLRKRYLMSTEQGVETPADMFKRVAHAVSEAERPFGDDEHVKAWEKAFFDLMMGLDFLPNSPTLMNVGSEKGQLSACFVLPVEDSLNSIFTTLKNAALIQQSGGGTGFNFSKLRPVGDHVSDAQGIASGPLSFIEVYNNATEHIKQGGRRRGANMAILNIDHPDIESFIVAKQEEGKLANFNLSVGITNEFMEAVERDDHWWLINPRNNNVEKVLQARELWELIIDNAWRSGDPGLVFLDNMEPDNPTPKKGKLQATNPCGEMPLLPYESCNLGSVNLSNMVIKKGGKPSIDWHKLEYTVSTAIRFLDDVIDVNYYLLPQIKRKTQANRKIGLGVMGWAEMLIQLGIPYASQKAVDLGCKVMRFINAKSFENSLALAEEKGVFPNWQRSIYYPSHPLRNATRTSIAPTGSISIIAGTSSSIEPLFSLIYERAHILDDEVMPEINPLFLKFLEENNLDIDHVLDELKTNGVEAVKELSPTNKDLFASALEIPWEYHIKHQLAFQQHTDNAVSKTINLPQHADRQEVEEIYRKAWQEGLKGITIYRYNSKSKQVLNVKRNACGVCVQ